MTYTDFAETLLVGNKVFGTVEASEDFLQACKADNTSGALFPRFSEGLFISIATTPLRETPANISFL